MQVSLKSTAKAGKNGNGLKDTDFKYNRNTYWLTSRETPDIVWIEQLGGQDEAVRSFVVRDKEDILVDMQYLDARDSFDSFLTRWRSKTIVKEYGQARAATKIARATNHPTPHPSHNPSHIPSHPFSIPSLPTLPRPLSTPPHPPLPSPPISIPSLACACERGASGLMRARRTRAESAAYAG